MARMALRPLTQEESLAIQQRNREREGKRRAAEATASSSSWRYEMWGAKPERQSHISDTIETTPGSDYNSRTHEDGGKPHTTIEKLPREILEQIIRLTLDLNVHDEILSILPLRVWYPSPQSNTRAKVSQSVLPLLLSCKLLSTITMDAIVSNVQFHSPNDETTEWLLTSLSQAKLLPRLRHVAIGLFTDQDAAYSGIDRDGSYHRDGEAYIKQGTLLLKRLPEDLRSLVLQSPLHRYPEYTSERGVHPALLDALRRLSNLRHLELYFYDGFIPISMFCAAPMPWFMNEPAPVPLPPPVFPLLRHLYLNGCLTSDITPGHMAFALSAQQLPRLRSLFMDGLLLDKSEPVFVPEVLAGMNSLEEFHWVNYDFDTGLRRTLGEPHDPPSREHLESLEARHGESLRVLSLNYTGWRGRHDGGNLTEAYLRIYVRELPKLQRVYIHIPAFDVKIQVGRSTADD